MSQCDICHHLTSKTILYTCDSGHLLFGKCRTNGTHELSGSCDCSKSRSKKKCKEYIEVAKVKSKPNKINFASADVNKTLKTEFIRKDEQFYKEDPKKIISVTYKNDSYQDNTSNTSLDNAVSLHESHDALQNSQLAQRPLSCPVCSKIIAMESVLQHFFFDHSKVPRYLLKLRATHRTHIKVSELDEGMKCLSVIILNTANTSPLLMMSTQVNISSSQNIIDAISTHSINHNQDPKTDKSLPCLKDHKVFDYDHVNRKSLEQDIHLLVWLCKITDAEIIYKVTLSREDKKMCFSYTGDAIHIRYTRNSMDMYLNNCLIIRRAAVRKLVNQQGQILLSVNVIHGN